MTPGELAAVRGRLEEFAPLAGRDQRDKGGAHVRGLLLDGRRKSMQPMAERLGVDEQGLRKKTFGKKAGAGSRRPSRRTSTAASTSITPTGRQRSSMPAPGRLPARTGRALPPEC